jgi:putative oxidoreductase
MQRLFSNFANGWPGKGLLIQRAMVAAILAYCLIRDLPETPYFPAILIHILAASAGLLLLIGLWTPIAGVVLAFVEFRMVLSPSGYQWLSIILVILGVTLAMIGPGAWSVDAFLFGRKHIEISDRQV